MIKIKKSSLDSGSWRLYLVIKIVKTLESLFSQLRWCDVKRCEKSHKRLVGFASLQLLPRRKFLYCLGAKIPFPGLVKVRIVHPRVGKRKFLKTTCQIFSFRTVPQVFFFHIPNEVKKKFYYLTRKPSQIR